jgi:uncharacterized protein (DUF1501 family)
MGLSRREFLRNGTSFIALGIGLPTFLMQAAQAQAASGMFSGIPGGVAPGKILVLVELNGGNDGLNTVTPYLDPQYKKLRPTIGIRKEEAVPIDANLALHPRMKPLMELYEKGHLAVVTGVGYPNPNYSHFEAMDIWQMADPAHQLKERVGWVSRYFDANGHLKDDPLSGLTLTGSFPLALSGPNIAASVLSQGQDDPFTSSDQNPEKQARLAARRAIYEQGTFANNHDDFIRKVGGHAYTNTGAIRDALEGFDKKANHAAKYPENNQLGASLQSISKLIVGGLETRVYYVSIGGFDTHANQPGQHANLLGDVSEAIAAFYRDLEMQGRAGDVALMTFSEFGRRAQENGGYGTDHGTASVLFVAGAGVKGGVHGEYPSLTDLKDGDLKFTTDFRRVYADLLDGWLGADSSQVLGEKFSHLGLV